MFLYLALMASICGLSACIFRIDFMLESLQREQDEVDGDGDQHDGPAEVVDERVVEPVDDQEQRLGQERQPAEIDHLLQLGVDALQQVVSPWGRRTARNGSAAPSETAAPVNGARLLVERRAHGVGEGHLPAWWRCLPAGTRRRNRCPPGRRTKNCRSAVTGPFLAALAVCSTSLLCGHVEVQRSAGWPTGLVTVRSPKPPRHSIMCGTGLPSIVTSRRDLRQIAVLLEAEGLADGGVAVGETRR